MDGAIVTDLLLGEDLLLLLLLSDLILLDEGSCILDSTCDLDA